MTIVHWTMGNGQGLGKIKPRPGGATTMNISESRATVKAKCRTQFHVCVWVGVENGTRVANATIKNYKRPTTTKRQRQ